MKIRLEVLESFHAYRRTAGTILICASDYCEGT
jgi:hypothetical protein